MNLRFLRWSLILLLLTLAGCYTYPGAIETDTLIAMSDGSAKEFDSLEGAQAFADVLQKNVKNISSSNPAITPRKGTFAAAASESGPHWMVKYELEFEVGKTAPTGPLKAVIAVHDEKANVIATFPLETKVRSKARANGANGIIYFVVGILMLSFGARSLHSAGPFALPFIVVGPLMAIYGVVKLFQAVLALF